MKAQIKTPAEITGVNYIKTFSTADYIYDETLLMLAEEQVEIEVELSNRKVGVYDYEPEGYHYSIPAPWLHLKINLAKDQPVWVKWGQNWKLRVCSHFTTEGKLATYTDVYGKYAYWSNWQEFVSGKEPV
jgi:hypothetical protein